MNAVREEIARLHGEAETARARAERARIQHEEALRARVAAENEASEANEMLAKLRHDFQVLQDRLVARREELATMSERLTSAEDLERRLASDLAQAVERTRNIAASTRHVGAGKTTLQASCEELATQVENLRNDKMRLEEEKAALEAEWESSRARTNEIDEALRGRRQSLEEIRSERNQRQIEKARNDADRDYLRQTCVVELNAQPEELIARRNGAAGWRTSGGGRNQLQRDEGTG